MAIYYVDASDGSNDNSGLSEYEALKDDGEIILKPGDTVLYKRGTLIRGVMHNVGGEEGAPITYSAYGEGDAPTFSGSIDLGDADLWSEEEKNLWVYKGEPDDEIGNFIFNGGSECGTLRWTKEECVCQGDFYDNCFGFRNVKKEVTSTHKTYLYSVKNPALFYDSLEGAFFADRIMVNNGHDMIIENFRFINAGVHVLAGARDSKNLLIRNCVFEHIGGGVWDAENKIRYGNAVEFWDVAENIEVTDCIFNDIYDSGVTHQGMEKCQPCVNVNFHHNVFIKCGMAAYEQRDKLPLDAKFNDNICVDAGEGFSRQGEIMPRFSEIWPQPMGHHIFLWRIDEPTENGHLEIKNNIFCNAPYGAAIYSIICEEAEDQIETEGNTYYTDNKMLACRWHGKDYKTFADCAYIDKSGKYEKVDIKEILAKRIKEIIDKSKENQQLPQSVQAIKNEA